MAGHGFRGETPIPTGPNKTVPEVLEIMYLSHFNIKEKPFTLSTDPRFLWVGANQRQALLTLTYGLRENEGLVVLGGQFGTGKTTLVNAFVQGLGEDVIVARLSEPGSDPAIFLQTVARGFGIRPAIKTIDHLARALARLEKAGRPRQKLLIIDEAQRLIPELQDELLRLAQLRRAQSRLIHILLVGENELYQWLTGPTREAFIQEVSATCKVHPLRAHETAAYIDHRLHTAGAGRTPFTPDAVREIHAFSQGVPRTINLICDYSLLHAHLENLDQVDAPAVAVCKDRFQIASLPDATSAETVGHDLSAVAAAEPPKRRSLQRTAILLLLLVAGGSLDSDSGRRPQRPQTASILEPSPGPAAGPSPRAQALSPPLPAPQTSNSPVEPDTGPSPPPVEVVRTIPVPTAPAPMPTALPPPPVVSRPSGDEDAVEVASPVQPDEAPAAETLRYQDPPAVEKKPSDDVDESERPEKNNDPGAIIDWLIRENRKD